jgi:CBS domain-containing protein
MAARNVAQRPLASISVRGHSVRCAAASSPDKLRVLDAMTREVVILRASDTLRSAMDTMLHNKISGAPVLDADSNLVGVLSETDLLWKEAGLPTDHWIIPPIALPILDAVLAWRDNVTFGEEVRRVLALKVADAMSKDVATIRPSATLQEAAQLMLRRNVNRLPVVEENDHCSLIGIVTRSDVVAALASAPERMQPPV